ncbi:MAG: DUF4143 domain-containing protein [Saprospirales bacterium]|nr:DUF4143 domain-containing protein [Saprospirales bacterium]
MFRRNQEIQKIIDILSLLAFQIGSLVSVHEISKAIGMSTRTVEKYLDLLEKVFVIKRLGGYSRNLRKEISKGSKYYFWDNGIRNAIINNFNELSLRNDVGALWENYLLTERLRNSATRSYFPTIILARTYDQRKWISSRSGTGSSSGLNSSGRNQNPNRPRSGLILTRKPVLKPSTLATTFRLLLEWFFRGV